LVSRRSLDDFGGDISNVRPSHRGTDFFRINLSHIDEEEIEKQILHLKKYDVPIILDTEGPQVRSGNTHEISFGKNDIVKIYDREVDCDKEKIFLKPLDIVKNLREGDLIHMDFDLAILKVLDISTAQEGYITCIVLEKGVVGAKRGVHLEGELNLPVFSKKDKKAIDIAKKHGVNRFTLSFIRNANDVTEFKNMYPGSTAYAKIECSAALEDLENIIKTSDGILIDRGDLSREVPFEDIPFIQKRILNLCTSLRKEAFVATNTLESMSVSLRHNQAEISDVVNILLDGAIGIALTRETAIGQYPIETVERLLKIMDWVASLKKDKEKK